VWALLDTSQRGSARLERAVARHEWNRALTAAKEVRTWSAGARLQLTRALYHAGRLPEDLLSVPQVRGVDLLPGHEEAGLEMSRALGETLFELGEVNLAERMAHEALEMEGTRPDTLRLLARINVLKERPGAARVFLNRLRLAPFHQAEAGRALEALATDPRGTKDAELSLIRTRWPTTDEAVTRLPTEILLRQLLTANRTNRMAYAYLLSHHLLGGDLARLDEDLASLAALGYTALPRPCEEALALRRPPGGDAQPEASGFPVRPAVAARYQRFLGLSRQYQANLPAGRAALAAEFGDTFWYYRAFGQSAPTASPRSGNP
jgi:hypothetical protein